TATGLGNYWVDLYRSLFYILLPLSLVLAVLLVSQGVVQTFDGAATATTLEGGEQQIARGPAASQVAIKQLGTNGGGFYNSNSAVPFENPNGFTNLLEMLAILLIPAAQVFMFGRMVGARRQAWPIYGAMITMFAIGVAVSLPAEQHGSQVLRESGVDIAQGDGSSGGNLADKEVRYGIANTALWATATTNASNGSVNGGHDAFTAAGGAVPIVNMFTGEVIFGGVGSGLYGMFFYILIAVFVAGLMVGRTPEYLGKKIEAREMKYAAVGALFVPTMVLVWTAIAIVTDQGLASVFNPGAHGFSETLYAYDSQSNNNGSAFAGFGATEFSALTGTVALWLGRFVPLIAALAIGGSLAAKRTVPYSAGTFRTDGPTFGFLLVAVVLLTAGLMIFPALTLGPIVEALS
ncbi:MAG TPA: potassium-transporting ATPase subunit KdpA, partial [Gaiellaceae bacterium]|nr:potassium-transporting ATPase subunit KdpA [Gaiellaceae bacterium]